jgi:hypothetical protein
MKVIFINYRILLLSLLLFSSCNDNSEVEKSSELTKKDFEAMANEAFQGIDYVIHNLENDLSGNKSSGSNINSKVKEHTLGFSLQSHFLQQNINAVHETLDEVAEKNINKRSTFTIDEKDLAGYTTSQKKYILEIGELLNNTKNIYSFEKAINHLLDEVDQGIKNPEERYPIYLFSSLTLKAVNYSAAQLNHRTFLTGKVTLYDAWDWKAFGEEVFKNAVVGGMGGALTGGTVLTPLGAVPGWVGGAIAGGLFGGASYAAGQIYDYALR